MKYITMDGSYILYGSTTGTGIIEKVFCDASKKGKDMPNAYVKKETIVWVLLAITGHKLIYRFIILRLFLIIIISFVSQFIWAINIFKLINLTEVTSTGL